MPGFLGHRNNVGWARLFFAFLVATVHGLALFYDVSEILLKYFRGTPFFAFISGFYIYSSYAKNPKACVFLRRRLTRILPLVYLSTGFTLVMIFLYLGHDFVTANLKDIIHWLLAQFSIFQKFWPQSLIESGIPLKNGSLWFISFILIMYLGVPLVYAVEKKKPTIVFALTGLSILISILYYLNKDLPAAKALRGVVESAQTDISRTFVMLVIYSWIFGLGILARKHLAIFTAALKRPLIALTLVVLSVVLDITGILHFYWMGPMPINYIIPLLVCVMFFCFNIPYLGTPPDISMGVFIWHIPIFYQMQMHGYNNLGIGIGLTVIIAFITYYLVERPIERRYKQVAKASYTH